MHIISGMLINPVNVNNANRNDRPITALCVTSKILRLSNMSDTTPENGVKKKMGAFAKNITSDNGAKSPGALMLTTSQLIATC